MAHKHEVEDQEEVEEQQGDGDHHIHVHKVGADKTMNTDINVNNSIKIDDEVCESVGVGGGSGSKAPRLPRWTRQEILVLIQGKKVAESRVRRGRTAMMGGSVEPKWATVSAYCKRHGVNRGAIQCRKRWSNLAGDFKKIREWEANVKDEADSFWLTRNDLRRERKLPGFFDRGVFDILNGTATQGSAVPDPVNDYDYGGSNDVGKSPLPRMVLFDSGRSLGSGSGAEGLFSQFEVGRNDESLSRSQEGEGEHGQDHEQHEDDHRHVSVAIPIAISTPTPISAKEYQHIPEDATGTGSHDKQPASKVEIGSTPQGGRKRGRREVEDDGEGVSLEEHLIKVLEKNGRILSDQLEAQNSNLRLDREERKEHASSLVGVLNKLADALAKIADKL